jgi:hypothetical protein
LRFSDTNPPWQAISREIQARVLKKDASILQKSREVADVARSHAESERFLSLQVFNPLPPLPLLFVLPLTDNLFAAAGEKRRDFSTVHVELAVQPVAVPYVVPSHEVTRPMRRPQIHN